MKLNAGQTKVISCTRKTNMIPCEYKLFGSRINGIDNIKDLGIIFYSKLYFHHHVDCNFFANFDVSGFYSYHNLFLLIYWQSFHVIFYFIPKLEYASVAWNSLTPTEPASMIAFS
jgi:hypothetical protein